MHLDLREKPTQYAYTRGTVYTAVFMTWLHKTRQSEFSTTLIVYNFLNQQFEEQ